MSAKSSLYKANFLWPNASGSLEEAAYEFANAKTEEYRERWWAILMSRCTVTATKRAAAEAMTRLQSKEQL